ARPIAWAAGGGAGCAVAFSRLYRMPKIRRLPDDVRAGSVSGSCAQVVRRPPLLLAAALLASGRTALYSCVIWLLEFVTAPMHDDVRLYYVAPEAGLRYGWSTIYDQGALRSVASSLPAAGRLMVSRRYRPVVAWAAASAALALLTVLTLGSTGLTEWWHVVRGVQHLPLDTIFTLAGPLSDRPLTYILWLIQGAMALWIAWARRGELEIVFAAGILGTVATASYFHNSDYCVLVVAGWLVLRTSPPLWHRLWLLVGVLTMQLLLTPLLAAPQL